MQELSRNKSDTKQRTGVLQKRVPAKSNLSGRHWGVHDLRPSSGMEMIFLARCIQELCILVGNYIGTENRIFSVETWACQ